MTTQINTDFIKKSIENIANSEPEISEYGVVRSVKDGIIEVEGLKNAFMGELVFINCKDGSKITGMVVSLYYDLVSVVTFNDYTKIIENDEVMRSNKSVSIGTGDGLLGRVVDPLSNPIDGGEDLKISQYREIEHSAPEILARKSVRSPLQTGIKIIDAAIPIGRGQRELIIGDRKTGKTTIAIDTIINQAKINRTIENDKEKVYSIYVAIGQKKSTITNIVSKLKEANAMEYTVIVASFASDDASLQYISPYSGCAIAEYFRDSGRHALIIYDDLSKHAVAYRQMSLLLKRPSGREAYPGDVFYTHSKLLERASQLSDDHGGGSLTALPIIETQDGDVSAYIPTNVISITDGQIFLEKNLFFKGQLPAVNIGLSVSRIGSSAQTKIIKKLAGTTKLELAQYRELEEFAKFSSDLDESTKIILDRGEKIIEILKQKNGETFSVEHQAVMLYLIYSKEIDKYQLSEIKEVSEKVEQFFNLTDLNKDLISQLNQAINESDFSKQELVLKNIINKI